MTAKTSGPRLHEIWLVSPSQHVLLNDEVYQAVLRAIVRARKQRARVDVLPHRDQTPHEAQRRIDNEFRNVAFVVDGARTPLKPSDAAVAVVFVATRCITKLSRRGRNRRAYLKGLSNDHQSIQR